MALFLSLFTLSFLWRHIVSINKTCDLDSNPCTPGTIMNCNSTECNLLCNGINACFDIEFNCDDTYPHSECNIICATQGSCAQTNIFSNRNTILQCLTYESCIANSTFLKVINDDITANIYANITVQYENVISDNYPTVVCEGIGIDYCAIHCMGTDTECNTYPQINPLCTFVDQSQYYKCSVTTVNDDKLILGQMMEFNDNTNYGISNINIPSFTVTDRSWQSNFIATMEFYIIETANNQLDYATLLSFCHTHNASQFIDIFSPIDIVYGYDTASSNFYTQISNLTFIFERGTVVVNESNNHNQFAWVILFGCNTETVYTHSMTVETQSIFSGNDKQQFMGIASVAHYNGKHGLPKGYNYEFNIDVTEQTTQTGLETQAYYIYIYYEQSSFAELTNAEYALLFADTTYKVLQNVTNYNNLWEYGRVTNITFCQQNNQQISADKNCNIAYDKVNEYLEYDHYELSTYFVFGILSVTAYPNKLHSLGTFIADSITNSPRKFSQTIQNEIIVSEIEVDRYMSSFVETHPKQTRLLYGSMISSTPSYIMYAFICACALLAVLGWCYSWYSGADNVNIFSVILFGIYSWDVYADIVFAVSLAVFKQYTLFMVACAFIVVPFIVNFATLFRHTNDKWIRDASIQYKVSEWLVHWNLLLMFLTLLSGSAFAAVELVNCHLFPIECFSMGLTARHIKKFSNKRLYSVVLCENVPQIILQIYFTFWVLHNYSDIVIVAFVTSILSISFSVIDIYATKKMFKTMASSASAGLKQLYFIEIGGPEIERKKKGLLAKPNSVKLVFAETAAIDPRSVNVILCIAIPGGIRIAFEVHSQIFQHKSSVEMLELLRNSMHSFSQRIQQTWKLSQTPIIKAIDLVGNDEIQTHKKQKTNANFSMQAQRQRGSLSSNRFFSVDAGQPCHTALSLNQSLNHAISLKDIEKINKEKEEMDRLEPNSSYYGGSQRTLNLSLNNHSSSHNRNILKYQKKRNKKMNINSSMAVEGPSSYKDENVQMLALISASGTENTEASISIDISDTTNTDLSMEPPSPNNINLAQITVNSHSRNETLNIVITSDLNEANVQTLPNNLKLNLENDSMVGQVSSRKNSKELLNIELSDNGNGNGNGAKPLVLQNKNNDSMLAEPGSAQASRNNSRSNSINYMSETELTEDEGTLIVLGNLGMTPVLNTESASMEELYVKPTMASAQSYRNAEQELDSILRHVMVTAPVTPVLETEIVYTAQNEENELELNSNHGSLSLSNPYLSSAKIDSDMISDIPSVLPAILESDINLLKDTATATADMVNECANDEEYELEIGQSCDLSHLSHVSSINIDDFTDNFEEETSSLKPQTSAEIAMAFQKRQSENSNNVLYRPRTRTSPQVQIQKRMPSHQLPNAPKNNNNNGKTVVISQKRKTVPTIQKAMPIKALPKPPLIPPKIPINVQNSNSNGITNF